MCVRADRLHLGRWFVCLPGLFVCARSTVCLSTAKRHVVQRVRADYVTCLGAGRAYTETLCKWSTSDVQAEKVQAMKKQQYTRSLATGIWAVVWPRLWPSIEYLASTYGSTTTCVGLSLSLSLFVCLAIFRVPHSSQQVSHTTHWSWMQQNCSKVFRQFAVCSEESLVARTHGTAARNETCIAMDLANVKCAPATGPARIGLFGRLTGSGLF